MHNTEFRREKPENRPHTTRAGAYAGVRPKGMPPVESPGGKVRQNEGMRDGCQLPDACLLPLREVTATTRRGLRSMPGRPKKR